jgi:hypothetical protein
MKRHALVLGTTFSLACSGNVEHSAGDEPDLDLCALKERSGCGFADCREQTLKEMLRFHARGCGAEYDGMTECTRRADPCGGSAAECRGERDRLGACEEASSYCDAVFIGSGCGVFCLAPGWAAECSEGASGVTCTCAEDEMQREFTAPGSCASTAWLAAARSSCL